MVLRKNNTATFTRRLYGGQLKSITLLKRNNDQQQGTVRALVLFQCRRSSWGKSGETIQADSAGDTHTVWHVPRTELTRVGVEYLNALDRIVEKTDDAGNNLRIPRVWQPEAPQLIEVKLFENQYSFACVRIDPPILPQ